jgi:hypothetical protein
VRKTDNIFFKQALKDFRELALLTYHSELYQLLKIAGRMNQFFIFANRNRSETN